VTNASDGAAASCDRIGVLGVLSHWRPMMRSVAGSFTGSVVALTLTGAAWWRAQSPVPPPPVKPGLWETRMSQLDANGKEVPSPEFAALSKQPPEERGEMDKVLAG